MKTVLSYLKPYKKELITAPVFKLAEAVFELLLPLMMAELLDLAEAGAADTRGVIWRALAMGGIAVLGLCSALVCQYYASVSSQAFGTDLRDALMKKTVSVSGGLTAAAIVNRLTGDTMKLQNAVAMFMRLVVRAPFLCVGAAVMAIVICPSMSLLIIGLIAVFVLLLWLVMFRSVPMYLRVQERLDKVGRLLREHLSGIRVVRAFCRTEGQTERFCEAADSHREGLEQVTVVASTLSPVTSLLMNAAIAMVVWLGADRVELGVMTEGEIVAFVSYITQIMLQMVIVARLVLQYTAAYASAKRVGAALSARPDIADPESPEDIPGKTDGPAVELSDVTFAYPGSPEPAVEHISFSVMPGETVGIIGATGSGKSTLVRLITREYDPAEGCVRVMGKDVRRVRISQLLSVIGLVPQKAMLFGGTVAENIRRGKPGATDDEVRAALEAAQAMSFVERMEGGINARVERGGANLSGGQKQRLTVARALVRCAPVLIMDDSSSALDAATDADLRHAVERCAAGAARIVISQRIGTVRSAHRIIMLDNGAVAGMGDHSELVRRCEPYRELCRSQGEPLELDNGEGGDGDE